VVALIRPALDAGSAVPATTGGVVGALTPGVTEPDMLLHRDVDVGSRERGRHRVGHMPATAFLGHRLKLPCHDADIGQAYISSGAKRLGRKIQPIW